MTLTIFKPADWMEIQSLIHRRTLICEENNEIKWITWLWRLTGYRRARRCAFTSFIYVVAALLYSPGKSGWIWYIGPRLCWWWHGVWTCFLTRSKDWGTVRGNMLVCNCDYAGRVWSLLNTAAPQLPIFNKYLKERGFSTASTALRQKWGKLSTPSRESWEEKLQICTVVVIKIV